MELLPACRMVLPAAGALLMALAGCVTTSVPSDPATPWTPDARKRPADDTWQATRALPGGNGQELGLGELADIALQNNPATHQAWHDALAVAAQVRQARGAYLPTLTGTATGARLGYETAPENFDTARLQYGPGLELEYLLLTFGGGRRAAVEQALYTLQAANYNFNQSVQDVLLEVATAYYGLVSADAGVTAAGLSVKDAKLALDTAQERKTAGVGTVLDVLQGQAGYDQARFQLAGAKGQLTMARGRLAQSLGWPADTPVAAQPPASDIPGEVSRQDLRRLIDDALGRRPDIAALRSELSAARAALTVAGSPNWPTLSLDANLNRNFYDVYRGDFQDDDWYYYAGLSLKWTLFDGLRTIYARRAAAAQADAKRARLAQAELAASAAIWNAFAAYETALERHVFSVAYLNSAQASYDLALDSYANGLYTMLDVVSAESRLAQARRQHIEARQDACTALAKLAHAVGRMQRDGFGRGRDYILQPTAKDQTP